MDYMRLDKAYLDSNPYEALGVECRAEDLEVYESWHTLAWRLYTA